MFHLRRAKRESTSKSQKKVKNKFKMKYSILLPTYNERENLPIIVWLLVNTLDKS